MQNVLEDLFFGELRPNICDNARAKKAMKILDENEDILMKLLEGKEKKLFLEMVNAQSEVTGSSAVENFIAGFKLGARIVVEALIMGRG